MAGRSLGDHAMKIWWRYIRLLCTCGLGVHKPMQHSELPGGVSYTECPRCHMAVYGKRYMNKPIHLHPPLWDVARGKYDRGIQP